MAEPKYEILSRYLDPRIRVLLIVISALAFVCIAAPAGYMVLWSFWGSQIVGRLNGVDQFTFAWFRTVLGAPDWRQSLEYSTLLGCAATLSGASLTAIYNYLKRFGTERVAKGTYWLMVALLLNPLIAYGIAMRSVGSTLGIPDWMLLYCGHLVIILPLQYFVFEAADQGVANEVLWASRTCGATHPESFFTVFLPNMRVPLTAALLVGFFVSFDEIVIALFVMEGTVTTVPLHLWRDLFNVVSPEAAVVSTILLCTILPALFMESRIRESGLRPGIPLLEWLGRQRQDLAVSVLAASVLSLTPSFTHLGILEDSIASLFSGGVLFTVIGIVRAWRGIWKLLTVVNAERVELSEVPRQFALSSIEYVVERAEELRRGRWIDLEARELEEFTRECFNQCRGPYYGTDRHVPSEFTKRYPDYLETQLNRGTKLARDVRILFCDPATLLRDKEQHPELALRFIHDHQSTGVSLFCVPFDVATRAAESQRLEGAEFGLFSNRRRRFAVFFQADTNTSVMLVGVSKDLRDRFEGFFRTCLDSAVKVTVARNQIQFGNHPEGWNREDVLESIKEGLLT
ncbi:MAG: hypothetical protein ABSE27_06540 [Acidobacteriaceae bacterium]